jgi:hypothetical protein
MLGRGLNKIFGRILPSPISYGWVHYVVKYEACPGVRISPWFFDAYLGASQGPLDPKAEVP